MVFFTHACTRFPQFVQYIIIIIIVQFCARNRLVLQSMARNPIGGDINVALQLSYIRVYIYI